MAQWGHVGEWGSRRDCQCGFIYDCLICGRRGIFPPSHSLSRHSSSRPVATCVYQDSISGYGPRVLLSHFPSLFVPVLKVGSRKEEGIYSTVFVATSCRRSLSMMIYYCSSYKDGIHRVSRDEDRSCQTEVQPSSSTTSQRTHPDPSHPPPPPHNSSLTRSLARSLTHQPWGMMGHGRSHGEPSRLASTSL